tara:strand:+ start:1531 stop:2355 length:825 start_codon:yes stop_codon:yes gene_type:complete
VQESDQKLNFKLKGPEGEIQQGTCRYLIGAGGAHSAVRKSLGLKFEGGDYNNEFMLGDVHVKSPQRMKGLHAFFTKEGILAFFPFDDSGNFRVIYGDFKNFDAAKKDLTLEELQFKVDQVGPKGIVLSDPSWLSRFRIHHRMAPCFQMGSIFLAGDAAHIHSPIGGQGMNTGIQDALSLCFKIYLNLRRGAPFELLKGYEQERLPIAKDVLRATDLATQFALSNSLSTRMVKKWLLPFLIEHTPLQKKMAETISQLAISRRDQKIRSNLKIQYP